MSEILLVFAAGVLVGVLVWPLGIVLLLVLAEFRPRPSPPITDTGREG